MHIQSTYSIKSTYPFGMAMEGRSYEPGKYRFGFQGQEKDDEIYGEGNSTSAEFWQYDARLGRRWNVDSKKKDFESPYLVNHDNPIFYFDPKGDEPPKKRNFLMRGLYAAKQFVKGDYYKHKANQEAIKLQNSGAENVDIQYGQDEKGRGYADITWTGKKTNIKNPTNEELNSWGSGKLIETVSLKADPVRNMIIWDKARFVRESYSRVTFGGKIAGMVHLGAKGGFGLNIGSVTVHESKFRLTDEDFHINTGNYVNFTDESYLIKPEDYYNDKLRMTQGIQGNVIVGLDYSNERIGQKGELIHSASVNFGGTISANSDSKSNIPHRIGFGTGINIALILGLEYEEYSGIEYYKD